MLNLYEKLPGAFCVYLGDTVHFPYGEKTGEEVTECASKAIQKIVDLWNPKAVVVACNTISVTALASLRERFKNLPIIGTVPAIKMAAEITKNKKIGLLATRATVNHPYCQKLIQDFASDCQVVMRADPKLIDFVEKEYFNSSEKNRLAAVKEAADFFKSKDCDTVILGCTHFTHIAREMQKECGEKIRVIDSRDGVANQAIRKIHGQSVSSLTLGMTENPKLAENSGMAEKNGMSGRAELPSSGEGEIKNLTFFVTKASESEIKEYETLCGNLCIPWGGVI
jgi:glutamate racemase